MKVFANGFNLYGQLIKPASLLEYFKVIFESEVIKSFGINHSFSYFHTGVSFIVLPKAMNDIIVDAIKIVKVVSTDERIIILYDDGMLVKLDYDEELIVRKLPKICDAETNNLLSMIVNVSCGSKINIFYSKNGKFFTMAGQLKFENDNIVQIECGREHCLLLDATGNVYSFGRGSRGQLGLGTLDDETEPILVEALAGLRITKISAGGWHSCALSADGDLYTWGWNSNGQLGLSKSSNQENYTVQATPQIVECFGINSNVTMIACGNRHTLALLDNKHLFGCGWNKYKQLRNDVNEDYHEFIFLHDFSMEDIVELRAGPWNSAVLCN